MRTRSATVILFLILAFSLSFFVFPCAEAAVEPDSWETLKPMQVARSGLGVAAVDGKIYAIGGVRGGGFEPTYLGEWILFLGNYGVGKNVGTNEVYDPVSDSWEFRESMPTPRVMFAITVYRGKIYCIGGRAGNDDVDATGVVEVYDPSTDAWETRAPMPTDRYALTAEVVGGKIYVIGGYHHETLNQVYDPETDSWTTKTSAPKGTSYIDVCGSAVLGDKIYVMGGPEEDQNLVQIYDTVTDTWSNGTRMPYRIHNGVAVTTSGVSAPKRIYILGHPTGEKKPSNLAYDPEVDQWTVADGLPTGRYQLGTAVVDDRIYVIGGYTYHWLPGNWDPVADIERYTPIGYIPEFPSWTVLLVVLVVVTAVMIAYRDTLKRT